MKNRFFVILLVIGLLFMESATAKKVYTKPLYVIEYSVVGTGVDIRVNDIPALFHDAPGQTSSEKQVPESIVDGENIVTIRTFPLEKDNNKYRQGAYVDATLSVREEDAPLNENQKLIHIRVNPNNDKEKVLNGSLESVGSGITVISHTEKETIVKREDKFKSGLPRWEWLDGQSIDNTKENYESLLSKYREIYQKLKIGDKAALFKIYDAAAKEFAKAYHLSSKESGHRLMSTAEHVGNDEWELGDFEKFITQMDYKLDIFANGKLARIVDKDSDSPIVYMEKSSRLLSFQKFGFYKNKNGEWIMIR